MDRTQHRHRFETEAGGCGKNDPDGGRVQTEADDGQPDAVGGQPDAAGDDAAASVTGKAQLNSPDFEHAVNGHRQETHQVRDTRPDEHGRHDAAGRVNLSQMRRADEADEREPRHRERADHHVGDRLHPDRHLVHVDRDEGVAGQAADVGQVDAENDGVTNQSQRQHHCVRCDRVEVLR